LIKVYKYEAGSVECRDSVDPVWLTPHSGVILWVDFDAPTPEEARILKEVFHFHELSIEDALAEIHQPKIESYGDYLYLVLHGIDFSAQQHRFRTKDVDFFLSPTYLVSVHHGLSRSVGRVADACTRNGRVLEEGTPALLHRIVDTMVDNYRPEVDKLAQRLNKLENEVFERPDPKLVRAILEFKKDVASLRQVVLPERDAVGRLARREFPYISEQVAYRFRDVHDHLIRLSDEAMFFQDRVSGILDAHLSAISNQLNTVMKVLTVISTIFMPLTFITGLYGMNDIELPHFSLGPDLFFWALLGIMLTISAGMLWWFRGKHWI
jgi:magnesium transporter